LRKLAAALTGTVIHNSESVEVSELFGRFADDLTQRVKEEFPDEDKKQVIVDASKITKLGRVAMVALQLGLILLCISALKLFLLF
jgi:hypothetical protein